MQMYGESKPTHLPSGPLALTTAGLVGLRLDLLLELFTQLWVGGLACSGKAGKNVSFKWLRTVYN